MLRLARPYGNRCHAFRSLAFAPSRCHSSKTEAISFLNIEDPEAFELAKVIAEQTGKSLTRVVIDALKHEKERVVPRRPDMDKIHALLAEVDALPILDARDPQEILDSLYDEHGLRA